MRIAVLSDTHMPAPDVQLLEVYRRYLAPADMVIHCGDHVGEAVWEFLAAHPCFVAVCGNCDAASLQGRLPRLRQVQAGRWLLGVAHGWGPRSLVGATVAGVFPDVHMVCYGHTHKRHWQRLQDGRWILNPGSLVHPRDEHPAGLALVDWDGQIPRVEWVNWEGVPEG
jgi:putative phosphoesterase